MIKINAENKHRGFLQIETQQPLDQKSTVEIKFCDENYPTLVTRNSFYVSISSNILYVCRCVVQRYGGGSGCLDSMRSSPAWNLGRPDRPLTFSYKWKIENLLVQVANREWYTFSILQILSPLRSFFSKL